jgi:hypothetical protein
MFLLGSCAASRAPEHEAAEPATSPATSSAAEELEGVEITLERTECYGWCPNYTVVIEGDGRVEYTGRSFVREKGERESTIPVASIKKLLSLFKAARFFELDDEYSEAVTDCPTTYLTLHDSRRTKRVMNYGSPTFESGPVQVPHLYEHQVLTTLAAEIDRTVGIERWIGTIEERRALVPGESAGTPGRTATPR